MNYICNAFSLNMFNDYEHTGMIRVRRLESWQIPRDVVSEIGHKDTARIISDILGWEIKPHRGNIALNKYDKLYVAQYTGQRLPEGATKLPEGSKFEFFEITVRADGCWGCRAGDCHMCGLLGWYHGI